jgi:O-antigen ligase
MIKTNYNIKSINLANFFFSIYPICFILGNSITNINSIIFSLLGLYILKEKIYQNDYGRSLKFILLFFFIIFFSTLLNFLEELYVEGFNSESLERLIKSVLFFRYFLLLIVIYFLSTSYLLKYKYFFYIGGIMSILIAIDIIFQNTFGFNIAGIEKPTASHNSGFFGDELIAGGYIKNFSIFGIFLTAFFLRNKKVLKYFFVTIVIIILGTGIILSGNRMPLLLFILGLVMVILLNSNQKKNIILGFIGLMITFKVLFSFNEPIKLNYIWFYENARHTIVNMFTNSPIDKKEEKNEVNETKKSETSLQIDTEISHDVKWQTDRPLVQDFEFFWPAIVTESDGHRKLFDTAIDTWSKSKFWGNGLKSFRIDCKIFQDHTVDRLCSNHPHNYYVETLTEIGLIGFSFLVIMALLFVILIFKHYAVFKKSKLENFIFLSATVSLIIETFPFRSTGSLFTTNNITYIILISSIILSYNKIFSDKKLNSEN